MKKNKLFFIIGLIVIIVVAAAVVFIISQASEDEKTAENVPNITVYSTAEDGFVAVSAVLADGVTMVPVDIIAEQFNISVSADTQKINGADYVPLAFLDELAGVVLSRDKNDVLKIWAADVFIQNHGWTLLSDGLVAHAGGGLFKWEYGERIDQIYTNSREALEFAYANGHRVFEVDFLMTFDDVLAAVHDWDRVGGKKTTEEWESVLIDGMYEALFLEDVYQFMLEKPDAFLVTDTKTFFADNDDDIKKQFEQLVSVAEEMDGNLLKRIIPQVYDQNCYDVLMEVYPFDSVIYTLYESPDSNEEVAEFARKHDNVKVITMEWYRLTDEFLEELTESSKRIYFFTINVHSEINRYRDMGAHGFYTDYINPK